MKVTYNHRVENAIRFRNALVGNIWLVIGKTSPWSSPTDKNISDSNPPDPDNYTSRLEEVIGAKRASVYLVIEDPKGAKTFIDASGNRSYWTIIGSDDEARAKKTRFCMVEADIAGNELPVDDFRELGFFSNLKPKKGFEDTQVLLPNQVDSYGSLEAVEYRRPVSRPYNSIYTSSIIIEF
jgi:hypothetical protein